jgi:predicted lipid-binding transport protein (Tim44 family)
MQVAAPLCRHRHERNKGCAGTLSARQRLACRSGVQSQQELHGRRIRMHKLITVTAFAIGLGLALPASAQQQPGTPGSQPGAKAPVQAQDCQAMWKKADLNNDGFLSDKELDKFRAVLANVDTDKDGKISQSEFTNACQKGQLKDIRL